MAIYHVIFIIYIMKGSQNDVCITIVFESSLQVIVNDEIHNFVNSVVLLDHSVYRAHKPKLVPENLRLIICISCGESIEIFKILC